MNDTLRAQPKRLEFRIRGREMNRVEAVSDVVFGFALTFAVLMAVWARHYVFFRCYGLEDIVTIGLNTVLLFVVLLYVYPLKFLANIGSRR